MEKKEIKTFSVDLIKSEIIKLLKTSEAIKEVGTVEVKGNGSEINLDIKVVTKKGSANVRIRATLESGNLQIKVKDYEIEAGMLVKILAKSKIEPELNKIGAKINSYIEEKEGKKVKDVWIENSQVVARF